MNNSACNIFTIHLKKKFVKKCTKTQTQIGGTHLRLKELFLLFEEKFVILLDLRERGYALLIRKSTKLQSCRNIALT